MRMLNRIRMLPFMKNMVDNFVHSRPMLHLRKHHWSLAAHTLSVACHHLQVLPHRHRKVGLVIDDQQVLLA